MNDEFDFEFELDEIEIGIEPIQEVDTTIPSIYLLLENLVILEQVQGLVEESPELITVPAYSPKDGELKLVGIIELTAENILAMQLLGLKTTLVREGKDSIYFDKADDYVAIIKTLKESDTVDIGDIDVSDSNAIDQEG